MFFDEINSYELNSIMNNNDINLIDIRDEHSYSLETIPGAKNIPFNYIISNPSSYLSKNDLYYIFCNTGNLSLKLCNYLSSLNYNVINVVDGYQGYKDSII